MRVTITIDEEKVFQAGMVQPDEGEIVMTSGEFPAEAKPMSGGGPPAWLLQQIEGVPAEPDPTQTATATEPMDAGPAPAATGNGPASMQAYFGR
jgi:hypothetical protein